MGESELADEVKAELLTGPGMFSSSGREDGTLFHSRVLWKSLSCIFIPFHTWSKDWVESQESVSNVNLQASVQDDRQEGDAKHIEEVEDAEQPHCGTLSLFLKRSKHVFPHTCES